MLTRPWDETTPADEELVGEGDDWIKYTKVDVRERVEPDHWMNDVLDPLEADCSGYHKKVTLKCMSGDPDVVSGAGILYAKVPGITLSGDLTSGSAVVTNLTSISNLVAGQNITGSGVPASTTISSIDSPVQLTMSANATATSTGVLLTVSSGQPELHYRNPTKIYQITNAGIVSPAILQRSYITSPISIGTTIFSYTADTILDIPFGGSEVTKTMTIIDPGAYIADIGDYTAARVETTSPITQSGYFRIYKPDGTTLLVGLTLSHGYSVFTRYAFFLDTGVYTIKCVPHIYSVSTSGFYTYYRYAPFRLAISNVFTISSDTKHIPVIA